MNNRLRRAKGNYSNSRNVLFDIILIETVMRNKAL